MNGMRRMGTGGWVGEGMGPRRGVTVCVCVCTWKKLKRTVFVVLKNLLFFSRKKRILLAHHKLVLLRILVLLWLPTVASGMTSPEVGMCKSC